MRIHVPREIRTGERRVAATPDTVLRLVKLGFTVGIESGAGVEAGFTDAAYVEAGAEIVPDAWVGAGLVTKVNPPLPEEVERLRPDTILVSLLYPAQNQALVESIAARGATRWRWTGSRASAAPRRWTCCRARWPTSPATARCSRPPTRSEGFFCGAGDGGREDPAARAGAGDRRRRRGARGDRRRRAGSARRCGRSTRARPRASRWSPGRPPFSPCPARGVRRRGQRRVREGDVEGLPRRGDGAVSSNRLTRPTSSSRRRSCRASARRCSCPRTWCRGCVRAPWWSTSRRSRAATARSPSPAARCRTAT
jgi:hypothetical protein